MKSLEQGSFLSKTRRGMNLMGFQEETKNPENYSTEGMSDEFQRLTIANDYLRDINRILKEIQFISYEIHNAFDNPDIETPLSFEDRIIYYQGSLLNATHQLKDKIARFCDASFFNGKYTDPKKIKISKVIKKSYITSVDDLPDNLSAWNQENDTPIGWALKRRASHHHKRSRLTLDEHLQKYQAGRMIEMSYSGDDEKKITKNGREEIQKIKEEGFNNWKESVLKETKQLIESIDYQVENLAQITYNVLDLDIIIGKSGDVMSEYFKMTASINIVNECDYKKIDKKYRKIIDPFFKIAKNEYGKLMSCVYLIGDIPRGDGILGYSSLEMAFVVNDVDSANELERFLNDMKGKEDLLYNLKINFISLEELFLNKYNKLRFFCKTDGILIFGNDLVKKEKVPKIGARLSLLLNSDVDFKISIYREQISDLKKKDKIKQAVIDNIAADVAKIALEVIYSGIIAESAVYERNILEIKRMIDDRYPENIHLNAILYAIASRENHTNLESLENLLSTFEENGIIFNILRRIEEVNVELDSRKKFK